MKVAIYCRLSEEDRNKRFASDDSNSIQNQKSMLIQYVTEHGWDLYGIYSDDDYAGSDRNRPEFKRLLEDAEARKFDTILCKTQSRFTRELELVEKYIHGLFPIWGIRFISIVDNADTANKSNKKSRQINGLVNEWYLEDLSENIRSVLTNRRENGYHIGAFALYGYRKDPDKKGHLLIDEPAAQVVREVFTMFSQGYGKTAIARILNERGIPNPTEYKRLQGLRYKRPNSENSTLWKYFAISDMLNNEIYIGNMVQGKCCNVSYKSTKKRSCPKSEWYVVEGTHEPIIDRALWDRVQDLLKERTKPFVVGTVGLFARKAKCATCGYTMRSLKDPDSKGGKHYLHCASRYVSKDACTGAFISVDRLEQLVLKELNRLAAEYLDRDMLEKGITCDNTFQNQKASILSEISSYEKQAGEYSKHIRTLYLDKVKGLITESTYVEMSKEFTESHARLSQLIADLKQRLVELEVMEEAESKRCEIIERYTNLDHLNREMVDTLIDYILVSKRIPGTRDVPIEIHWKF